MIDMALVRTIAPNEIGTQILIGDAVITIVRVGPVNTTLAFEAAAHVPIKVLPPPPAKPA